MDGGKYWIGLEWKHQKWAWTSGMEYKFKAWGSKINGGWSTQNNKKMVQPAPKACATINRSGYSNAEKGMGYGKWLNRSCDSKHPYVCEVRDADYDGTAPDTDKSSTTPDSDGCAAKAGSFAGSIGDQTEWQAFKDRATCKEKASAAQSLKRTSAVAAYLAAAEVARGKKASEDKKAKALKEIRASKKLAQKALEAARTAEKEAGKKTKRAQDKVNKLITSEGKAQKALKKATDLSTKTDTELSTLKKAALAAHAAFGKGLQAMADEI